MKRRIIIEDFTDAEAIKKERDQSKTDSQKNNLFHDVNKDSGIKINTPNQRKALDEEKFDPDTNENALLYGPPMDNPWLEDFKE